MGRKTMNLGTSLIGKRGTLADLHVILHRHGFSFQKEIGDWQSPTRVLVYTKGKQTIRMTRIERGKLGQWTGRRVGSDLLVGSYPFARGSTRVGYFHKWEKKPVYQTPFGLGH